MANTTYSRKEALKRARNSRTNVPGTCQLWTRTIIGAPSAGDQNRDGDSDAVDGWQSEPAKAKHRDRKPPAGYPVAWSGGANGYGHRAISMGPNRQGVYMIRSTDAGGSGKVRTVPLSWVEENWGLKYEGWSETMTGLTIENDIDPKPTKPKPTKPKPTTGTKPPANKPPVKKTSRGARVDEALESALKTRRQLRRVASESKGVRAKQLRLALQHQGAVVRNLEKIEFIK